jgi:hypothetical protein
MRTAEIEKGWNDRETTERGEDNRETERKYKMEGCQYLNPTTLSANEDSGASLSTESNPQDDTENTVRRGRPIFALSMWDVKGDPKTGRQVFL